MGWSGSVAERDTEHGASRPGRTEPVGDESGTAVRPGVRDRGEPGLLVVRVRGSGRAARQRTHRVRDGVLRDLVGVDELHLVRQRLRLRRHLVPVDDTAADGRGVDPRCGRAGRAGAPGFPADRRRLCGDACRDGVAVAPCCRGGSAAPARGPHLRRRDHARADRLGRMAGDPRRVGAAHVRRVRRVRVGRARGVRAARRHPVAPGAHRRSVRLVHVDRAGRDGAGLNQRDHSGAHRRVALGCAHRGVGERPGAGREPVVVVLRPTATSPPRPGGEGAALGIRALLRVCRGGNRVGGHRVGIGLRRRSQCPVADHVGGVRHGARRRVRADVLGIVVAASSRHGVARDLARRRRRCRVCGIRPARVARDRRTHRCRRWAATHRARRADAAHAATSEQPV